MILFTSEYRRSNTTGGQTEEDGKAVSEGTHNCMGCWCSEVWCKTLGQKVACYTFCDQAG